ncbi:PREDICTED: uncharacterized protein LOC105454047 [Wasmannia auropunctata]|uniref:uncharacterized protein LOC105454047 n=1 Tax=Wasmannia auropunctata TaxID=64793 RepID=UPI0005EE2B2A|nr:PREDICTED: uncharacterized protein LOC105454047 [Wasmannia auropunctata]
MIVVEWQQAPNKGSERVALLVKGVRIQSGAIVGAPASSLGPPGPGQGSAIKAYCVAPRTRSVSPRSAQEKLTSHTMKFFIVLFAVVAAVSAGYEQVYHAHYIPQQPAIPPPHPGPLHIKGNDHVTRIHYDAPHVGHPHLVGVEHYVAAPEPAISVVKTHGHGW